MSSVTRFLCFVAYNQHLGGSQKCLAVGRTFVTPIESTEWYKEILFFRNSENYKHSNSIVVSPRVYSERYGVKSCALPIVTFCICLHSIYEALSLSYGGESSSISEHSSPSSDLLSASATYTTSDE